MTLIIILRKLNDYFKVFYNNEFVEISKEDGIKIYNLY